MGGSTYTFHARQEVPQAAAFEAGALNLQAKPTNVTRKGQITITGMQTGAVTSVSYTIQPNILQPAPTSAVEDLP